MTEYKIKYTIKSPNDLTMNQENILRGEVDRKLTQLMHDLNYDYICFPALTISKEVTDG